MSGGSLVTAIVPAFNSGRTLSRAIDSVLSQRVAPARVVVVDDASTDDTREVAAAIAAKARSVEVLKSPVNGGAGRARQLGIDLASSEYVAFLDADDEWHPDHVGIALDALSAHPRAGAVFSSGSRIHAASSSWQPLHLQGLRTIGVEEILIESPVVQSSVVARTSAVVSAGGYRHEKRFAEDFDLWLRLAAVSDMVCLPGEHVRLYHTPGQLSQSKTAMAVGMWEAIAHFERWAEGQWREWRQEEFARLIDATLDTSVRAAKSDWDASVLDAVLAGARTLRYRSPRIEYWRRWKQAVWPFLHLGHRIDEALPSPLRTLVRGVLGIAG
jgi:glycosyltransferase involved in cell wall biosynthesis